MNVSTLQSHRILVAGLGVTGASVARFLSTHHVAFDVSDECSEEKLQQHSAMLAELSSGDTLPGLYNEFSATLFSQYSLIVLSPGIARSHPAVQAAISNGVDVIGDIELFASAVRSPVIAVTGSNGKSTVVAWLAKTLQGAGVNAVACGNIGESALDSLTSHADVYVLELSSYQLESTRSLRALSATVLNVSDDHLDRYDDIEHYAAVKRHLYAMTEHCVANQDDQRTWPDNTSQQNCEYFSLSADVAVTARWHRGIDDGRTWLYDAKTPLLDEAELSVPGEHNVANALALIALLEPLNIDFENLRAGLIAFNGLAHRSQFLGESNGVRWYNDSKGTNVDACMKAISAMPGPVILIAGGIAKDADFAPLHPVVNQHVKLLLLIGRDREQIARQLQGATVIQMASDLQDAVRIADLQSQPGDTVLLSPACSSFDMFENFEARGEQFAEAVAQVLAA